MILNNFSYQGFLKKTLINNRFPLCLYNSVYWQLSTYSVWILFYYKLACKRILLAYISIDWLCRYRWLDTKKLILSWKEKYWLINCLRIGHIKFPIPLVYTWGIFKHISGLYSLKISIIYIDTQDPGYWYDMNTICYQIFMI